jgi:hypothetical protein
MVDPLSLAAVGGVVLTEGIKFLYGQAGELLKRWRDRRSAAPTAAPEERPLDIGLPAGAFEGRLDPVVVDDRVLDELAEDLLDVREALSRYGEGFKPVPPDDPAVLEKIDALRLALEAVIGQRITFLGEAREPSGIRVTGRAFAETVRGRLAGIRATQVLEGELHGEARATQVEEGGEAFGVHVDVVGRPAPYPPSRPPRPGAS